MIDILRLLADHGVPYYPTYDEAQVKIDCPVCQGQQKAWVRTDKEAIYCHKCQWTPDGESFVRKVSNLQGMEALKVYKAYQSMPEDFDTHVLNMLNQSRQHGSTLKPSMDLDWPENFLPLEDPAIPLITNYACSRKVSLQRLKNLKVGGCPSGPYAGYLILPVLEHGKLVFWQGREAWGREHKLRYRTPTGYSASQWLFNLDEASRQSTVVLCEGVFSALRAGPDAVATFGNKVTEAQVQKLRSRGVQDIIICFDPDTWTAPKAQLLRNPNAKPPITRAVQTCLGRFDRVRVVRLREGDPDEIGPWRFREALSTAIPVSHVGDLARLM